MNNYFTSLSYYPAYVVEGWVASKAGKGVSIRLLLAAYKVKR